MTDTIIPFAEKKKEKDAKDEKAVEGALEHLEEAVRYQEQMRTKREADRKKKNDELIRSQKLKKGRK